MAKADPQCTECYGEGSIFIPAHQQGGRIVDEREVACRCTKNND